jgi:hypothetical protein
MVEESESIYDKFHALEKQCVGFENYVNCDDKHYMETLEKLRKLVVKI